MTKGIALLGVRLTDSNYRANYETICNGMFCACARMIVKMLVRMASGRVPQRVRISAISCACACVMALEPLILQQALPGSIPAGCATPIQKSTPDRTRTDNQGIMSSLL